MTRDDKLKRASRCRLLAELMRDPKAREMFMMAAQTWEAMAYFRPELTMTARLVVASHRRQRAWNAA
jgi:hypothetical protein